MEEQPIASPETLLQLLVALETADGPEMPVSVVGFLGSSSPQLLHVALKTVLPTLGRSTSNFRQLALNELLDRGLLIKTLSQKGTTQLRVPTKVIRMVSHGIVDLDQLESVMLPPAPRGINITLQGANYGQVGTGVNRQDIGSVQVGYQDFRQTFLGFVEYGLSVEDVFSIIDTLQDEVQESRQKKVGPKTEGRLRRILGEAMERAGKAATGAALDQAMKQLLPLLGPLAGLNG